MDDAGFAEFFRHAYAGVLRTVSLALGSRDRAEEVTQEAFARAYRRWRVVRRMDRPDAWVIVVAVNAERRRFRHEESPVDAGRQSEASASDHAEGVIAKVAVRDALARLTDRQRAVVVLRYLADLRFAEVADALGCAEGTARATLHQALAKMRIELTGDDMDGDA